jgi:hypothetical protein
MDEILSSIRQIIADDDAAAPRRPMPVDLSAMAGQAGAASDVMPGFDVEAQLEPLALSADQIVSEEPAQDTVAAVDFSSFTAEAVLPAPSAPELPQPPAQFIDPEDIAFETEPEPEPAMVAAPPPRPVAANRPVQAAPAPPPIPRAAPAPVSPPAPRPRQTAAQAAPMPDPTLSSDIAEELVRPTTDAVVRANFAKLNNLGLGNSGLTIESMMRDMLRPMLKDWLDEHLPAMVERMVEKEISRISRGVE